MLFQWRWFEEARGKGYDNGPPVLNVGCADDPLEFGDGAHHFDIDDWSYLHKWFTQGDAHNLPFPENSFDVVVMGDIHEHVLDPLRVTLEGARVTRRLLVMTIFEEWKLPGPGQHIRAGQINSDQASRELGFADRQDYQRKTYPEMVLTDDDEVPHLIHINQFSEDAVREFVMVAKEQYSMTIREYRKEFEAIQDGHPWFNWLVCLEKDR